jgi:hypothetical protein
MSGGKLIQHVNGHSGNHTIHFKDSIKEYYQLNNRLYEYEITSTHHQMMFPYNIRNKKDYEILAWSSKFRSKTYLNGKNEEISLPENFVEPEIIYYPETYSLCIQGHPEMKTCPQDTVIKLLNLIDSKLINNNIKIKIEEEW